MKFSATKELEKLEKFDGIHFRCWKGKMHFFLVALKLAHVLKGERQEEKDAETMTDFNTRSKWKQDDFMCKATCSTDCPTPFTMCTCKSQWSLPQDNFGKIWILATRQRRLAIRTSLSVSLSSGTWQWKFEDNPVNVYYEEHEGENNENTKRILMMPTISDVSTVEEWRVVAQDIVTRSGGVNWRATIVDWPGLGYSDRPTLEYNADVMENFFIQFMNAPDSPLSNSDSELVIIGGGHAATIALRAAGRGQVRPSAIAAVAPTWAGPLPIVFGRGSDMESRYGLLRGTLRAPAVGWMMYNFLVSNEKAIQSQYKSHVYADPNNVTPSIIESRYALTKKKGARYVPAAFLTGLLDPVQTREEFLNLFSELDGKIPILVVSTANAPKRSKAEMDALKGARGVGKFVEVPGALLPQEEYPLVVSEELYKFLLENF